MCNPEYCPLAEQCKDMLVMLGADIELQSQNLAAAQLEYEFLATPDENNTDRILDRAIAMRGVFAAGRALREAASKLAAEQEVQRTETDNCIPKFVVQSPGMDAVDEKVICSSQPRLERMKSLFGELDN